MSTRMAPALRIVQMTVVSLAATAAITAAAPTSGPPGPPRIVAIGDLHGDLAAAVDALRLAGAVDADTAWAGDDLVVVQLGDQLDRGDGEEAILELFDRLAVEAAAAGGAVHALLGNHEIMNVQLDLRYVTDGGWADFSAFADAGAPAPDSLLASFPPEQRGRVAAFRPGGPWARKLARRPVVLRLGGTVFVHGGLRPEHLEYGLDRIGTETSAWLLGDAPTPDWVSRRGSPVWARDYSDDPAVDDCDRLAEVLDSLDAERMVVAHTPQENGVTAFCGDRVWCVDVGLAAVYGGETAVLEISGDSLRVLRASATDSFPPSPR